MLAHLKSVLSGIARITSPPNKTIRKPAFLGRDNQQQGCPRFSRFHNISFPATPSPTGPYLSRPCVPSLILPIFSLRFGNIISKIIINLFYPCYWLHETIWFDKEVANKHQTVVSLFLVQVSSIVFFLLPLLALLFLYIRWYQAGLCLVREHLTGKKSFLSGIGGDGLARIFWPSSTM